MFKFLLGIVVGLVISSVGLVTIAKIVDDKLEEIIIELEKYEGKSKATENTAQR